MQKNKNIDFLNHNKLAWNKQAMQQNEWSRAVSSETIAAAKAGDWKVHLTPQALDPAWLGDVSGKRILCLASAGGQQAPVLAAAGAVVTVFDISDEQLAQDCMVAERDGLKLVTEQGDMTDLSRFADASFDMVFHPISNHYIPDVNPVWRESYRILKQGGMLLASFFNPIVFVADRNPNDIEAGIIKPRYRLPYADIKDLNKEALERKLSNNEALVFGHTLTDLIAGQTKAGFAITGFIEDDQPHPRFLIDKFVPTFLATKAIKL